ncbi:Cgr1 family-domain-containing protein [Mrakia frigida]|uniref:Cgr1p n=1 Tax=Mrakia frigida TaxID=29902 RepID=UPI003FCC1DFF
MPAHAETTSSVGLAVEASTSTSTPPRTLAVGQSAGGRVSGKFWKQPKTATRRSNLPAGVKTPSWDARVEKRKKEDAIKLLEKTLKDEKLAEEERKKTITKERKLRVEEKKRLEEMAARMSAKKLQRMKKRLGRSKKVNG